ncbi:hypothetical protein LX32DRAFT_653013 [Colletotrichum zoysiae]|uniref:Uncharacterized protein n=1 Tax=Colletotrichum zoysiae TaxID=1216348 RepID=A0AAD9LZS5_9PEZI|nr:hypothetical protein LX32DRAFT_653013 [Colletotrichum zoysiae]
MSSNGSSSEAAAPKPALTEREYDILKFAWNCMKTPPEIDYPLLAAACGMTNPRSASNAWGAIKKKLFADMPPAVDEDGNPIPTPSKRKRAAPAKKKAAPAPAADEGDELAGSDDEEKLIVETPKKKRTTPAKKKAAAAADAEGADNDEEAPETPAKKKRAPAKRKTPAKGKKTAAAADSEEQSEAAAEAAAEDAAEDAANEAPAADVAKLDVKDEDKADVDMEKGENQDEI